MTSLVVMDLRAGTVGALQGLIGTLPKLSKHVAGGKLRIRGICGLGREVADGVMHTIPPMLWKVLYPSSE